MTIRLQQYPDTRPKTRGECADMPRPCPFLSCRYHLAHHWVAKKGRGLDDNQSVEAILEAEDTCALDVADRGPQSREDLASITKQHINMVDYVVRGARSRSESSEHAAEVRGVLAMHSNREHDPRKGIQQHTKNRGYGRDQDM